MQRFHHLAEQMRVKSLTQAEVTIVNKHILEAIWTFVAITTRQGWAMMSLLIISLLNVHI